MVQLSHMDLLDTATVSSCRSHCYTLHYWSRWMNARENSSTAWHYQVPLQKHYADRGQWLRMASVLSITREGPSVYLNERMEAAFEILQSDGSTRSTLSLPLSHAGNGPPAAPKDNDLPHKHAQAIFYSILSLWRGLHFLVPLLYNR